ASARAKALARRWNPRQQEEALHTLLTATRRPVRRPAEPRHRWPEGLRRPGPPTRHEPAARSAPGIARSDRDSTARAGKCRPPPRPCGAQKPPPPATAGPASPPPSPQSAVHRLTPADGTPPA